MHFFSYFRHFSFVYRHETLSTFFKFVNTRCIASQDICRPPSLSSPPTTTETAIARGWLAHFTKACIPRDDVELTFARSSGPGGQNVNKVNTKATVRCPLDRSWIPEWARDRLIRSPAYVASSKSLLVTSTLHRSQAQNIEDCFEKLHLLIRDACLAVIPTPADPARLARKEAHQRVAKQRHRVEKSHRSTLKKGRRGGDWRD